MKYALLLLPLILFSRVALAAMPVEVVATASDSVGSQLVYQIKEDLRKSSSLQLTFSDTELRLQAQIVTLEQYPNSPGASTVYSVVLTLMVPNQSLPFYLTQYTGYCGASAVNSCADTVVSKISEASDSMLRAAANSQGKR